ncbi:hypothetical protein ACQHIV_28060 [Kribbella sp. GL6]|uniref:hypothetical protein n=1 Tax=Kribbella sp. GL6 TaxID=3419765 RepID=UPI003D07B363
MRVHLARAGLARVGSGRVGLARAGSAQVARLVVLVEVGRRLTGRGVLAGVQVGLGVVHRASAETVALD